MPKDLGEKVKQALKRRLGREVPIRVEAMTPQASQRFTRLGSPSKATDNGQYVPPISRSLPPPRQDGYAAYGPPPISGAPASAPMPQQIMQQQAMPPQAAMPPMQPQMASGAPPSSGVSPSSALDLLRQRGLL